MDAKAFYITCQVTVRLKAADQVKAQDVSLRKLHRFAQRITVDGPF